MPAKQKIGIVGMGAAGWAFVPAIAGHAAFELAAITEPAADLRETVAKELGVAVYADLPSMLEKAALDAVYIATPTELHPEHVALCCSAKKNVLTEKPMAIRVEQAVEQRRRIEVRHAPPVDRAIRPGQGDRPAVTQRAVPGQRQVAVGPIDWRGMVARGRQPAERALHAGTAMA